MLHLVVTRYNSPCGSAPETRPRLRSAGARHSHMTIARAASKSCSFPSGTRYPARLPKNLDLRRIGFVLLQQASDSAPLPDTSSTPPGPKTGPSAGVSSTTREKIRLHSRTLIGLRRSLEGGSDAPPTPSQHPTPDANGSSGEEEEEEQSEICLALSESSSSAGSHEPGEPSEVEAEHQQRRKPANGELHLEEEQEEEPDDAQRQQEEQLFAQEYLLRVRLLSSS